jgi:hypothetical protein
LAWSEWGLAQMTILVVYNKNGQAVSASDIRVPLNHDEQCREASLRRNGWDKYNNYMDRQLDLTLSLDWANVFQKEALSFGKVDASFIIRKSFGALRFVV